MQAYDSRESPDFGIYVHWPFCTSKCPYCNFNVHLRDQINHQAWCRSLIAELRYFVDRVGSRTVTSVFFGGGTPSLMEPWVVSSFLDAVALYFSVDTDCEVTLEANPEDSARFTAFRSAGITRLSLGLQSFEDNDLIRLGRHHSVADNEAALTRALNLFPKISCDLIYARPGQTSAAWSSELSRVIAFGGSHLSLYQLTVEPGTAFYQERRRGTLIPAGEDAALELFLLTQEICEDAGLAAYEVSNHAYPGHTSRHNLVYWQGGDYLGIGPGAHGRVKSLGNRQATMAIRHPESWMEAVARHGHGLEKDETIEQAEEATEHLMMGLRLSEGVSRERFSAYIGQPLEYFINQSELETLGREGFIITDEFGLRATLQGRRVLDTVISRLIV